MSDPNVSVERQARWHRPAILSIIVAIVAAIMALFFFGAFGRHGMVEQPGGTIPSAVDQAQTGAEPSAAVTPPVATTTAPATN